LVSNGSFAYLIDDSPVSVRASGLPGIPGWFTEEQQEKWKTIVDGVHAKGAIFFAQLWHQGRNTHSAAIAQQPESASDVPIDGSLFWSGMPTLPFEAPRPMTVSDIRTTQDDFVKAAIAARQAGCDGVELHAGNGYLFDQFLHDNSEFESAS
jgi:2,4-dienoyl-CoA reductase-like NADH-dependent reductase (Old Yellow Enzyme family)